MPSKMISSFSSVVPQSPRSGLIFVRSFVNCDCVPYVLWHRYQIVDRAQGVWMRPSEKLNDFVATERRRDTTQASWRTSTSLWNLWNVSIHSQATNEPITGTDDQPTCMESLTAQEWHLHVWWPRRQSRWHERRGQQLSLRPLQPRQYSEDPYQRRLDWVDFALMPIEDDNSWGDVLEDERFGSASLVGRMTAVSRGTSLFLLTSSVADYNSSPAEYVVKYPMEGSNVSNKSVWANVLAESQNKHSNGSHSSFCRLIGGSFIRKTWQDQIAFHPLHYVVGLRISMVVVDPRYRLEFVIDGGCIGKLRCSLTSTIGTRMGLVPLWFFQNCYTLRFRIMMSSSISSLTRQFQAFYVGVTNEITHRLRGLLMEIRCLLKAKTELALLEVICVSVRIDASVSEVILTIY